MTSARRPAVGRLDLGIFLISFAVLLLELLVTRIFAVTLYNHHSYMVVSLAMLGFGASGLLIHLAPGRFPAERLSVQLAWGSMLFALAGVVAVGVSLYSPLQLAESRRALVWMALTYGVCGLPFFAGGLVVALLLVHRTRQANRLYFFDLAGAAFGCLASIAVTNLLGAPSAVLVACGVGAVAACVFAERGSGSRTSAFALVTVLAAAAAANVRWGFFDVVAAKGEAQPALLAVRWNAFSRVEVDGTPDDLVTPQPPYSRGFSETLDPSFGVPWVLLRIDAFAATPITHFDGRLDALGYLRYDVSSAAHQIGTRRNVLVIGAGGGRDVLMALGAGSERVTAVEINPIAVEFVRTQFRDFTGGLYADYPGVRVVVDDGRSFVKGSRERYDLIHGTVVTTATAAAVGAQALAENSLYTVEAFEDYLDRLAPGGVVSFSWWTGETSAAVVRMCVLAREALERRGVADPGAHVVVVSSPPKFSEAALGVVLVKESPFTGNEIASLRTWAAEMRFSVDFTPEEMGQDTPYAGIFGPAWGDVVAGYRSDISPTYDDRPFFFSWTPLLPWLGNRLGLTSAPLGDGPLQFDGRSLLVALSAALTATVAMLLLPLFGSRRGAEGGRGASRRRAALWVVYFAGLGFGFIAVEVTLIQRFNLLLGYPVYALAAVLFTVLLASGLGSLVSGRWSDPRALPAALAILCAGLATYVVTLPSLPALVWGLPVPGRVAIAVALCAPVGFLLGIGFPTGLRRVAAENPGLVSWAWALNGASSVLGSVATTVVAMSFGFTASLSAGLLAYGAALAACLALGPRPTAAQPQGSSDRCRTIPAPVDIAPPVNH